MLLKKKIICFITESCTIFSLMRHGMLVMLHTLEGHRRKGYAKSCVAAAAKRMLSMGLKPMAGSAVRYFSNKNKLCSVTYGRALQRNLQNLKD